MRIALAAFFIGTLLFPARSACQTSSVSGVTRFATGPLAAELVADMTKGLQQLIVAQEDYYGTHGGAYGKVLSRDDRSAVYFLPPPGVTITPTYATTNAWIARATHDWRYETSCVVSIGRIPPSRIIATASERLTPKEDGRPACDEAPQQ